MSAASSSVSAAERATRKLFGSVYIPNFIVQIFVAIVCCVTFLWSLWNAYRIRTYSLTEYGMVIHEFDPWFNFRATQYLSKNGWDKFFHWFDYMSWYPLGRPVGTTIYPGLQITSVVIHRALKWLGKDWAMSLNDVCCTVPCWFGAVATFFLALITLEVSKSIVCATIAAAIFAIIPAHMMRSVGGGYDNESIAMTAMLTTFYFWIRSVRTEASWPIAILAGLAYGYMVAAWGGFVFVLNMVAVHAAGTAIFDWVSGKYSRGLHISYSIFFVIGTSIAVCVPPVGWMPFKSLEQLLAFAVFLGLQVLAVSEPERRRKQLDITSRECFRHRMRYFIGAAGGGLAVVTLLAPSGFFGPLSSRVRGLFVPHTRTGNPLVDSVAEHQPATADAYWQYLHLNSYFWTLGTFLIPLLCRQRQRALLFICMYTLVAYFFSLKMSRLIILTGPIASISTGILLGHLFKWCFAQGFWSLDDEEIERLAKERKWPPELVAMSSKSTKRGGAQQSESFASLWPEFRRSYTEHRVRRIVFAGVILAVFLSGRHWNAFNEHCEMLAHSFANPQIMFKSQMQGKTVMIDDYREAYFWIRKNTPEDSRVMAWWDYGYQITGIANRTSIADGNTWNHEHIATLGKCLTSPVKEAHSLIRHLADYVLVWAGGGGDDLAKSPHMARIGNSVYYDICPDDPFCAKFGFDPPGDHKHPTPMMKDSLLFNLHQHGYGRVRVDPALFTEAYTSKYGLIRVFKVMNVSEESRAWLADPANRICDAPGSWYCVGQYPPAPEWKALLDRKLDFAQLEDFNNQKKRNDDYHRKYMARSAGMGH